MPLLVDIDDVDHSVSMTWSVDEDGTLHHNPSGMRIMPDSGVEVDGHEYRLSPQDIELEGDRILGAGSCGMVQAGLHKPTGMRVAIKTVKVDNKDKREQMLHEIQGLIQAAGCPYLVQWYAGFVARGTGLVHVVIELMDRGSLADMRNRLNGQGVPSQPLACVAAQVTRGLHHLQTRRMLHRDVKPENILHNAEGQVKLTDFGISKDLNSTVGVAATFVGTASYMSPERSHPSRRPPPGGSLATSSHSHAMSSPSAMSGSLSQRSSYDDEALLRRAMAQTHSRKRQHPCVSFTLSDVSTAAEDEDGGKGEELGVFSLDDGFSPAHSADEDPREEENEDDHEYGAELFQYELVGLDDEGDEGSNDAPPEAVSFSPSPDHMRPPWLQRRNSSGPPPIKALRPCHAPLLEVPTFKLPPPALSLSDAEDEDLEPSPRTVRSALPRLAEQAPAHQQPGVSAVLRAALGGLALEASCRGAGLHRSSSYTGSAMKGAGKETESAMKVEDEEDEEACVFMLDDFSPAATPSTDAGGESEGDDEGALGASLLWQRHVVPQAGNVQVEGLPPAAPAGF